VIQSTIRRSKLKIAPWLPGSEFLKLEQQLVTLEAGLPSHFRFDELNTYIHRDQNQLGALVAFHLAYHQCYCDLYRVVLPGYQFPITEVFAAAPIEFIQKCQEQCRHHAEMISQIAHKRSELGGEFFTDPLCGICIYESTKIQVIYMTCLGGGRTEIWELAVQNILYNIKNLQVIESKFKKDEIYVSNISISRNEI
jgi:hypothetical protein